MEWQNIRNADILTIITTKLEINIITSTILRSSYTNQKIPIRASLPESCFSILPSTGELIVIKRGEAGYFKSEFSKPYVEHNRIIADNRNIKFSVTKAQEAAMLAGAMFDWTVSAADPKNYDEKGTLILC